MTVLESYLLIDVGNFCAARLPNTDRCDEVLIFIFFFAFAFVLFCFLMCKYILSDGFVKKQNRKQQKTKTVTIQTIVLNTRLCFFS